MAAYPSQGRAVFPGAPFVAAAELTLVCLVTFERALRLPDTTAAAASI